MRIRTIRPVLLRQSYVDADRWHFPGGSANGWNCALLEIETDNGLTGLGESIAGATAPLAFSGAVAQLRMLVEDRTLEDLPALMRDLRRSGVYWCHEGMGGGVLSAFEIACLDILGKAGDVPVWQLLGSAKRQSVRAYVSAGFMQGHRSLAAEMGRWTDDGWTAVKIRAFGSPLEASDTVGVARSALGNSVELMVDFAANFIKSVWSLEQGAELLRLIAPHRVAFAEEVVPTARVADMIALQGSTRISLAGGESVASSVALEYLATSGAVHVLQPDATHCGGLQALLDIAEVAANHDVMVAPHHWASGVSLAACLHLGALLPREPWLEVCGVPNVFQRALLIEWPLLQGGRLTVPSEPGLGVHLPKEVRERFEVHDLAKAFY